MRKLGLIVGLLMSVPAFAAAEIVTNDTVLKLIAAGMPEDVIIAKIKASPTKFELDTDKIIVLKKSGVSGPVLAAMIGAPSNSVTNAAAMSADSPDPMIPRPSGVYMLDADPAPGKMVRIDPTTSNQTKTGNFLGYALTGGIASMSFKAVIPNENARVVSKTAQPVFYFYFDQANGSLSSGAGFNAFFGPGSAVTSPSEFSLVRFDTKSGRREAKVGKFNIGGAKSGVMDKDRIPFQYDQIAPGVFKVSPSNPLSPGEYGFLYSVSGGGMGMAGGGNMMARVFDFSLVK